MPVKKKGGSILQKVLLKKKIQDKIVPKKINLMISYENELKKKSKKLRVKRKLAQVKKHKLQKGGFSVDALLHQIGESANVSYSKVKEIYDDYLEGNKLRKSQLSQLSQVSQVSPVTPVTI
jgi:hypothetical protein